MAHGSHTGGTGTRFAAMWMLYGVWLCSAVSGQQLGANGSIHGVVRDPAGAVVPGAEVMIENASNSVKRTVHTDQDGVFTVPALPPAAGYSATVNKAGFAPSELAGITVLVGEDTNVAINLKIAGTRTKIAVEEAAPVASLTKVNVSQVIENSQIMDLPINGRRVDTYVLLTPAVVPDGVQGLVSFRGMAGGNAFLTDGNDTSNQFFSENAGRTRISTQISQDAVQEFQSLASGYSAEYGRASGGIINTITRSGSNDTHGTVYAYFRNRTLNARDPHSTINPPEKRLQTGASLGGNIVKDRLFYFFNTEIHRREFPLVASLARPPLFDANGNFVGTCNATPAQCSAALQFLNRQFQVLDRSADSELLFGRLDWSPSDRNRLSASFNYLRWISPNGYQTQAVLNDGSGVGNNGDSSVRTRYGRLTWTLLPAPTVVNEVRFGWFKDRHSDNINPQLVPPETGLVQIAVQGQQYLGVNSDLPRIDPSENRFQIADTLSIVKGRHSIKAGADLISTEDYLKYLAEQHGSYEYSDFTTFAQDFSGNTTGARRWQTYSQRFGNEIYDQTIRDYDVYAEDQFQLAARATITAGLRYEYSSLPQPAQTNPDYPNARVSSIKTNFAPRIGITVGFDQSRTVLRGGYGLFYGRYPSGVIGTFFLENGVFQQSVVLDRRFLSNPQFGPVFPNSLPAFDPGQLPGPSNPNFTSAIDLTLPSKSYRNAYTQQADIGIERAITSSLGVSATYLWNRGLHLTTVRDLNIGPATTSVSYLIDDAQGNIVGTYTTPAYRLVNRVNPQWRRVNSVDSGGNSYYDALAVQVRKRMAKGWDGFITYTWSHTIDFNQGGGADNLFYNQGPRSLWNGNYRAEKSSSQLDQRHRLIVTLTYEPAFASVRSKWARALANGWRISQVSTFASSQPATAVVLVDGVPFPGAAFNTTLNGFGGSTRVPFLPASDLNIDQVIRTDARLSKTVPLSERCSLQLLFEAFNVFNHSAGTAVNTIAYEASGGILRPVAGLGDIVASQGYPDGTNARRAQVGARLTW